MFEMKSASFAVNDRTLLHPTDLCFEQGKVYGLIGHNGSGKSTLLKLLARQQPLSDGEIRFDDKPLPAWGRATLPVRWPICPSICRAPKTCSGGSWWRWVATPGAACWVGWGGGSPPGRTGHRADPYRTLCRSVGGYAVRRRAGRVWLAMLLAQESRFILLDEPLAALDVAHQVEVLTLVKQLSRQLKLGVIIVIHDINMASRFCDRLVALHSGRLLTHGVPRTDHDR